MQEYRSWGQSKEKASVGHPLAKRMSSVQTLFCFSERWTFANPAERVFFYCLRIDFISPRFTVHTGTHTNCFLWEFHCFWDLFGISFESSLFSVFYMILLSIAFGAFASGRPFGYGFRGGSLSRSNNLWPMLSTSSKITSCENMLNLFLSPNDFSSLCAVSNFGGAKCFSKQRTQSHLSR